MSEMSLTEQPPIRTGLLEKRFFLPGPGKNVSVFPILRGQGQI